MFTFNLGNAFNISRSIRRRKKPSIFENFLVVESFFWFTDWLFRVAIILKWFHQECFLGSLPLGLCHPFLNIFPENNGGRVLLLVKLQTDCSEYRLYKNDSTKNAFMEIFRLDCLEVAVRNHPCLKIYSVNTGGGVLPLVKLQAVCSE